MRLTFLGATETVTGSKFLLETEKSKVLIDCGLFQGLKELRLKNWTALPFDPASLDAVVLTHAHIDHTGYLPVLFKQGFRGQVYATRATHDLCTILLPDAGYLQEEDARFANQKGYSKHKPAEPLFTEALAHRSLSLFRNVEIEKSFRISDDVEVFMTPAGHILGATSVHLRHQGRHFVFSGDVGRPNDPLMKPPQRLKEADVLVLESTYGERLHDPSDPKERIAAIVHRAVKQGGVIVIPAFAVGRSQTIMYLLSQLKKEKKIPDIPIYLDSPMAIAATEIFCAYRDEHKISAEEVKAMCEPVTYVHTSEESKMISHKKGPMVIISASGMAGGGRVLHHLKMFAPDEKNTVLFVGYQPAGSRGEAMLAHVPTIKIHGEYVPMRARVENLESLSAHADAKELIDWVQSIKRSPQQIFLVHGEPSSQDALRRSLYDELKWNASIPHYGETVKV